MGRQVLSHEPKEEEALESVRLGLPNWSLPIQAHSSSRQIVPGRPSSIWPILKNSKAKLALGNPNFMNVSVVDLVLIIQLEKWCVFSKIGFYTSYCDWRGSSSWRSSLAAPVNWLYAMGRANWVSGEVFYRNSFSCVVYVHWLTIMSCKGGKTCK